MAEKIGRTFARLDMVIETGIAEGAAGAVVAPSEAAIFLNSDTSAFEGGPNAERCGACRGTSKAKG